MHFKSRSPEKWLRRLLPRTLLGRSLLIILLPLVLVEAVAMQFFYGSHLNLVSRRLAASIAGEIEFTLEMLDQSHNPAWQALVRREAWQDFEFKIQVLPGTVLPKEKQVNVFGPMDDDLAQALRQLVRRPAVMNWVSNPQSILLDIQLRNGIAHIAVPRKRLYPGSILLFLVWVAGTSLLVFGLAAWFMRNQVRAIRRLAAAAESFGMGRDQGPIKPEGAKEVRQAANAFNRMQERIRRFLAQRTELLAGVSHDLRTPLTRLRLALAMLPVAEQEQADVAEMTADVEEMERMISGYLAFARGEGTEQIQAVNLAMMLEEVAADARRTGAAIELGAITDVTLPLRPDAMRRALTNLIDNARRHAQRMALSLRLEGSRTVRLAVDDDGPGIPPERRESVFRPFESGAADGTGLGLTIARDIVRAHGGDIVLQESPLGGLRALVSLPV